MPIQDDTYDPKMPYQLRFPDDALEDIVIPDAVPKDERLWVPQAKNVCFRPLCLSRSQGYWMNLLRVRKSGVLSRHRHPQAVHGFVLKGRWHYLEHDWEANEGSYVYEPPGETHTLVVPEEVDEMITYFSSAAPIYRCIKKTFKSGRSSTKTAQHLRFSFKTFTRANRSAVVLG